MNKRVGLCLALSGVLASFAAFAAPPSKPPPAPAVPVIADSAGVTVGPVVPVLDAITFYEPMSGFTYERQAAALYRSGSDNGKVYFGGHGNGITDSDLQLLGPVKVYYPYQISCGVGTPYVQERDLRSLVDMKGYGSLAVYPKWPGRPGPVLVKIEFGAPYSLPATPSFAMQPEGTCSGSDMTDGSSALYPLTFVSDLNWVGPFFIK